MRIVQLTAVSIVGTTIGFFGTLALMDAKFLAGSAIADSIISGKPFFVVEAVSAPLAGSAAAALKPLKGGVEVASTFDPATGATTVDGAGYVNIEGTRLPPVAGRKLVVELEATAIGDVARQSAEIQFVENGLGQSGWKRLPLKAGRQKYRIDYIALPDDRLPSKTDTIWIRSDADGRGRPLIVHAIRMYFD